LPKPLLTSENSLGLGGRNSTLAYFQKTSSFGTATSCVPTSTRVEIFQLKRRLPGVAGDKTTNNILQKLTAFKTTQTCNSTVTCSQNTTYTKHD
jgi:hypothetical protein